MPSPAAIKYELAKQRASILRNAANTHSLSRNHTQVYYHAALAAIVAAWDAYIKNLIRDFFSEVADPLVPKFHAIHTVAQVTSDNLLDKFNTPNWENTRNLLILCTGYDPINDWSWARRRMGVPQVKERLNQILKVRHSFAHGFALPAYSWTQTTGGRIRLTSRATYDSELFFNHLVKQTDKGMKLHITSIYAAASTW
jgi:hypothetical protein